jgi:Rod binding domain-containing protein
VNTLSTSNKLSAEAAMMAARSTSKPIANGNIEQLRKTAQDFEASFLSQMLKPMFANLGAEKPFGGGTGEDMWRSLQVNEYGKAIAQKGGIGLADSVFREMLKLQEEK